MSVVTTSQQRSVIRPSTTGDAQRKQAPGSMTAVMRAMPARAQATGPKVLRIGLVQEGRVVEDRILKDRGTVTVGPSETATLVLAVPGLPAPAVKLFERVGDVYRLHLLPGMTGRVALETGVTDVERLVTVPGARHVPLSEATRGRLVLGGATLLFQFVAVPVAPSRPQLPLAIKAGLSSQIDWNLTIIAAFSFLVHFGVVGAMYSDWMDPLIDTEATANGVVDLIRNIPAAPIELPPQEPGGAASTTAAATPAATHVTPSHADHLAPPVTPVRPTAAEIAALAAAADDINVSALTALHAGGTAVQTALSSTEIPLVDLEQSAGSEAGARLSGCNDLRFGHGADAVHPGSTSRSLGALVNTKRDARGERAGDESGPAGPTATVNLEPPMGRGAGQLSDAASVIAGLRAGFRSCYNHGLSVDPTMSGRVMLTANVATNGEVSATDAEGTVGLSSTVVQCLRRKLGTAQFAPIAAPTSVKIPVGFIKQ